MRRRDKLKFYIGEAGGAVVAAVGFVWMAWEDFRGNAVFGLLFLAAGATAFVFGWYFRRQCGIHWG